MTYYEEVKAVEAKARKYDELKEAVEDIKTCLDSKRTAFILEDTYEEGRNVGLLMALDIIDKYTEGLI